jgi:hypothetical protein
MSINQCICFLLHHLSCPRDPSPRKKKKRSFVRSFVRSSTGSPAERGREPPSANATRRYPASTRLDSRAPHPIRVDNKSHIFRVLTASSSPLRAKQTGRVFAFIRIRRIRVSGAFLNAAFLHSFHPVPHRRRPSVLNESINRRRRHPRSVKNQPHRW